MQVLDATRHVVSRWDRTVTSMRMVDWSKVNVLFTVLQLLWSTLSIINFDIN